MSLSIPSRGAYFCDITAWSDGIITKGVLLDVTRHRGVPHVQADQPVHGWELEEIAGAEGVTVAGHGNFRTPQETSNLAIIDPQTLEVRRIFRHPRIDGFEVSTTAVQIGNEIWLGTNRGEMIAYFPVPD